MMREYRNYERIRARQERVRRAVVLMLIVIVAGAILLILRSVAHGQTDIGEPVCYVSAPAPQSGHLNCIQPRVFVPLAMKTH